MSFREETRKWLEDHCPASMRTPFAGEEEWVWGGKKPQFPSEDARLWLSRMADKRWIAPRWPERYGGAGLSADEARVLDEEMRRLGCRPPLKSFGVWMLAPVLFEFGSEAQRLEHLPPIARGEIRWCQGYSEPGAGSDLAGLQTRAVRDGDFYIVDGQKVWTSHADQADWMFCLVRTDQGVPKHDGISFLLIDMASPGISVRPIRLISGASPFCETFFEGVRVPAANLVGTPGGGWTIAKRLLEHERAAIAHVRSEGAVDEEPLESLARRYGALDPSTRDEITRVNIDSLCLRATMRRAAAGAASAMLKLCGTEWSQRQRALRVRIAGFHGLGWQGGGFSTEELRWTREWLRSRAGSIEGGTSEIQLNIIAKRILGLPD
jgi:acyl-CoA dehydrogenase